MPINFPSSPANGASYTYAGKTWVFTTGRGWVPAGSALSSASKTADFTFSTNEADRTTVADSSSAIVATIPPNSSVAFPLGTKLRLFRANTGTVKFAAGGGVTLRLPTGIAPRVNMGALVRNASATGWTTGLFTWDTEAFDTHAFHSTSSNTDRLVIPSGLGIKRISLVSNIISDAPSYVAHTVFKNGSTIVGRQIITNVFGNSHSSVSIGQHEVADSDYFSTDVGGGGSMTVAVTSNFEIKVDEIDAQGFVSYRYGAVEVEKIATNEWIVTDHSALG